MKGVTATQQHTRQWNFVAVHFALAIASQCTGIPSSGSVVPDSLFEALSLSPPTLDSSLLIQWTLVISCSAIMRVIEPLKAGATGTAPAFCRRGASHQGFNFEYGPHVTHMTHVTHLPT